METLTGLRGRSIVAVGDCSPTELGRLLALAAELQAARRAGRPATTLPGTRIALLFDGLDRSTTPEFDAAVRDLQLRVVSSGEPYDALDVRAAPARARQLAASVDVPVYNGLSGESATVHVLADLLTIREHSPKTLAEISLCYLGDGTDDAAAVYLVAGAKLGMDVRVASPISLQPAPATVDAARASARETGGRLTITHNVELAALDADVIVARVHDEQPTDRNRLLRPYAVDAADGVPADGPATYPLEQIENRVHTIEALLVATLAA